MSAACTSLDPEAFPSFELPLQSKCFLSFFSQIALGSSGLQLRFGVLGLQLVDLLQQSVDFVASFGHIIRELLRCLLAAGQLRLEIFDCAVYVASGL